MKLNFILDVDGVMTTGQFLYSKDGKSYKVFGPHDSDGLKLLMNLVNIRFVTADRRGFEISKRRIVDDLGFDLALVSEAERYQYIETNYGLKNSIYMGDGFHDAKIIKDCFFGIAPQSARIEARSAAKFVTPSKAGEGAVLDACLFIKEKFFDQI